MSDKLLGVLTHDPVGMVLGTGYMRFSSPFGIDGLVRTHSKNKIEFLAVVSLHEGKGNFHRFIDACKERYETICIWHDWNPAIGQMAKRWGFKPETQMECCGEMVSGWQWDRNPT